MDSLRFDKETWDKAKEDFPESFEEKNGKTYFEGYLVEIDLGVNPYQE